ncbi:hypothetical protein HanHA300_Chr15g0579141 [Helianthus annuus]|nr:hypothetical protein HanHA300_Chr15g0579141 [Helianthus annuus]
MKADWLVYKHSCEWQLDTLEQLSVSNVPNFVIFEQVDRILRTGDPCLQSRIFTYLNRRDVQDALYANTTDLPGHWDFCLGFVLSSFM